MAGTTGDIIWKHVDPKTWELSNTPTADTIPDDSPAARSDEIRSATGKAATDAELMQQMYAAQSQKGFQQPQDKRPTGAEGREWRKHIKNIRRGVKNEEGFPMGLADLFQRGDVWVNADDGGLYSRYPLRPTDNKKLLGAMEGLSRDDRDFVMDIQRRQELGTYAKQQQDMQLMQNMGYNSGGQ